MAISTVTRAELPRAARYGAVGVANVAIDFALYALLVTLGVWYPLAKALSLTVATANGYYVNRTWTFRAGPHRHVLLARYVTVQAGCYLANVALLFALVEGAGLSKIGAQVVALPAIAGASFLTQRLWTFRTCTQ
jgi:putative flippase GtrA